MGGAVRAQRGMVTVESAFAALFVTLALALAIGLAGVAFVLGQCQVTANEVARQAARGDEQAVSRAMADAPAGAVVMRRREAGATVVDVTWRVPIGPGSWQVVARSRVLEER